MSFASGSFISNFVFVIVAGCLSLTHITAVAQRGKVPDVYNDSNPSPLPNLIIAQAGVTSATQILMQQKEGELAISEILISNYNAKGYLLESRSYQQPRILPGNRYPKKYNSFCGSRISYQYDQVGNLLVKQLYQLFSISYNVGKEEITHAEKPLQTSAAFQQLIDDPLSRFVDSIKQHDLEVYHLIQTDKYTYNSDNNVVHGVDTANKRTIQYSYKKYPDGRILEAATIIAGSYNVSFETRFTYNAKGLPDSIITYGGYGSGVEIKAFHYNQWGIDRAFYKTRLGTQRVITTYANKLKSRETILNEREYTGKTDTTAQITYIYKSGLLTQTEGITYSGNEPWEYQTEQTTYNNRKLPVETTFTIRKAYENLLPVTAWQRLYFYGSAVEDAKTTKRKMMLEKVMDAQNMAHNIWEQSQGGAVEAAPNQR